VEVVVASGEQRLQSPATAPRRATKRRAVLRAMLRGTVFGAAASAIGLSGIVGLEFYRHTYRLPKPSRLSTELFGGNVAGAVIVVLFCAVLAALLFGIAAVLSPRPRPDESDVFADREGGPDRPYSQRLRQFLHADVSSAPGDVPSSPRSAFLAYLLPGGPTLPKSAAYIRAILWRIHHLIRGS
jgi:hypothetical protein